MTPEEQIAELHALLAQAQNQQQLYVTALKTLRVLITCKSAPVHYPAGLLRIIDQTLKVNSPLLEVFPATNEPTTP